MYQWYSQKQYVQEWNSTIENSSKCLKYRIFKTNCTLESCLLRLPRDLRISFIKIHICNHRLQIETGRWSDIDRNLRICTMCDRKSIGDEYHYVMEWTYFSNERKILLPCRFHKKP